MCNGDRCVKHLKDSWRIFGGEQPMWMGNELTFTVQKHRRCKVCEPKGSFQQSRIAETG